MDKSSSNDDGNDRPSSPHAGSDENSLKESSPQTLVPGAVAVPVNVSHEDGASDEATNASFASELPATTITRSRIIAPDERENVANNKVKIAGAAPPASVPGAVSVSLTQSDSKTAEATDASFASEFPATTTVASRTTPDETESKTKFARSQFPTNNFLDGDLADEEEEKTQEVESDRCDEDVIAPSPLVRNPGGRVRYSQDSSGDTKNQRNFQLVERIAGPNIPPSEEGDETEDVASVHSRSVETPEDVVLTAEVIPAKVQDRGVEAQNVEPIHYDEKPSSYRFRWRGLPGALALVVVIAVVVVTVVLVVVGNKGNDPALTKPAISPTLTPSLSPTLNPTCTLTPSMSPSTSPTLTPSSFPSMSPTWSPEKQLFLENLTFPISGDSIYEEGTPQSKAFSWLAQRDLSGTDVHSKLVELYALAVLYYATNGPSWSRDRGFLLSNEACSWNFGSKGVFCKNGATNVREIHLESNNLQGTVPDELSALTALRVIGMGGNDLSGTIPPTFGNLTMLEELDLTSNSLTGTIPTAIATLPSLKSFDARNNSLTGGIPSFSSQQLSDLHLYGNLLNGSLEGFFNSAGLAELKRLRFHKMELTGSLPTSIGNFPQFQSIELYGNSLNGTIPTEIGLLTNLTRLDFDDNNLSGTVPIELGNCTGLRYLYLRRCGLGGSFPSSVAHLSTLDWLEIQGNNFTNDYNETFCMREDPIWRLSASCLEDNVVCPCCDYCCNATGEEASCVACWEFPTLCSGD